MSSTKRPVRYLASICADCGHTYNWHIPGDVCKVRRCLCKQFVDQPVAQQRIDRTAIEHGWIANDELGAREYRKGRRYINVEYFDTSILAMVYAPKGEGNYYSTVKVDDVLAELAR